MTRPIDRRSLLLGAAASTLLSACAMPRPADPLPPIVFMHGNGDTAGLWLTQLWRFESNGWPRERLFTVDVPYPLARDDDAKPQDGRSGTADNAAALAAEIDRALAATGADRVVVIANSRGGYALRQVAAGAHGAKISHAIVCGTPNHGVWADLARAPGSEFNGRGAYLAALNAPKNAAGDEVTPGPRWMTIRSDTNDKFAQPDGAWIGAKGTPTNVSYDGPALRGAENVVIAGIDHRETGFGPQAFEAMHRFVTGRAPATVEFKPESRVRLSGVVSGYGVDNRDGTAPSNRPLVGARVAAHRIEPATAERIGPALWQGPIGADGRWGPVETDPSIRLEFVIEAPGYAVTHIYRSPFARSSAIVNLRAERMPAADRSAAAVAVLSRPRGYFGVGRDRLQFDGQSPPPGLAAGTAGLSTSKLRFEALPARPLVAEFNGERVVGRAWPAAENHWVVLEITR